MGQNKNPRDPMLSDPKVSIITISQFMKNTSSLRKAIGNLWQGDKKPEAGSTYYKFTPRFFVELIYSFRRANFGTSFREQLVCIIVAYRDVAVEKEFIKKKHTELKENIAKYPNKSSAQKALDDYNDLINSIPPYCADCCAEPKHFEDHLVFTGVKETVPTENHYLVIDVETNGLRTATDDLLSLSIFDPKTGVCYNRFFPLDRQPMVLTTHINGLTEDDLLNATHLTQEEMDELIRYFDFNNAKLLSYSGGKGTFDFDFFNNYCKRHKIKGLEKPELINIKSILGSAGYEFAGQMTKDNLCNLLGIEGVTDIHSGINDCILEWKLFETVFERKLVVLKGGLYEYSDKYVIPVSYLFRYKGLRYFAGLTLPDLDCSLDCVFSYRFEKDVVKKIKKFPTNITGITFENTLKSLLGAKGQDNYAFMARNKSHLKKVGQFENQYDVLPVYLTDVGHIEAENDEDEPLVKEINRVNDVIAANLEGTVRFIKDNIFKNEKIASHELVFSCDNRVFAECDFSSNNSVLEIKTRDNTRCFDSLFDSYKYQLYYQSAGRKTYLLKLIFERSNGAAHTLLGLVIEIYKVTLTHFVRKHKIAPGDMKDTL